MAATTDTGELPNTFEYIIPGWLWESKRASVLRAARALARRKGMSTDGDPVVHVVLVWPQEGQLELPIRKHRPQRVVAPAGRSRPYPRQRAASPA